MQDNNKIRSIQCPGSSAQWNGWGSDMHSYPASDQQRTFKFNDDEDADADPIRNLRTKDGYEITLNGTVYFKTSFDCSARGRALVKKFDQANFSRPDGQKPWEDWSGWLENQWKPILDSTARDVILSFAGKDVVAAIVLLSQNQEEKVDLTAEGQNNKSSVQRIESALKEGLVRNLKTKLGEDYFIDITFNMEQPRLASEIEKKIRTAQAAFGRVADARAERVRQEELVKVERQKRKVAFERSKGYANCPSCARQDELRSLPKNLNTLVLGSGSSISLGRGGR
jgi:hypothetical protein